MNVFKSIKKGLNEAIEITKSMKTFRNLHDIKKEYFPNLYKQELEKQKEDEM